MHRIGILGAAGIAPRALIAPVRRRDDVVVGAVASRAHEKAAAYAAEHDIPVAHAGYDALLADPAIDLVYNALPPAGHAEWTIKALAAGKHVLCEKPFAMTADEARAMVAAAETHGRVLMEAFHDRYHPAFLHLLALKPAARRHPRAPRRVPRRHPLGSDEHPLRPGAGRRRDDGPRLLPAALAPELHGRRARGRLRHRAALRARLRHPRRGRSSASPAASPPTLFADIQDGPFRGLLRIEAENGSVELDNPCLPHTGHSFREEIGGTFREYTVAGGTTYDYQLAAFLAAVDTRRPARHRRRRRHRQHGGARSHLRARRRPPRPHPRLNQGKRSWAPSSSATSARPSAPRPSSRRSTSTSRTASSWSSSAPPAAARPRCCG